MSSPCDRFAALSLSAADGHAPDALERTFCDEHRAACPDCRREARALSLLRMGPDDAPHFPYAPEQRERIIAGALAAVDAPELAAVEPLRDDVDNVVPLSRRIRKPALWAAGLAAAAALLLVVRVTAPTVRPVPAPGPAPLARVLLSSGGSLSAGMALSEGQEISAAGGEASLALGSDIVLLLEPGTQARLSQLQSWGIEVALASGCVHASVKEHTAGPRLAVTTADGRVEVTGTLFAVEAREGKSELRVLRGSVKASAPGHKASRVEAFQAQRLGDDGIRAMSEPEQQGELAAMRRIGLLEVAEAAVLQIRSVPAGARVSLDGEAMGTTPLSAEVKTGHRHLVVASADNSRDEWIDLYAGATVPKEYDLAPAVAQAAEPEPEPARAVAGRPSPFAHLSTKALLERAYDLRHGHDYAGSAAAYRELLKRADVPHDAWISYGQILVEDLGDPKGALKACGHYLDSFGWEGRADIAAVCRIRALQALGRRNDERAAIESFLARFPESPQRTAMQSRLGQLK